MKAVATLRVELEGNDYMLDLGTFHWFVQDTDSSWIKVLTTNKLKKLQNIYNEWLRNGK